MEKGDLLNSKFKTATFLLNGNIGSRKVYVEDEPELAKSLGLKQAPTLIVQKDGEVEKIVNVSNIRKFIDELVKPSETVLFN